MIRVPDSERIAVLFQDRALTYHELHQRAEAVADRLRGKGIAPGSNIGLQLERSLELLPTILGIWKAGCAYVPVDRPSTIVDAQISLLITPDGEEDFSHVAFPPGLAYILYTSGTTGQPNGVAIEHSSVQNHAEGVVRELEISERDTLLAIGPLTFDISVTELFAPLVAGACVALAAPGEDVHRAIAHYDPDILVATPATWQILLAAGWQGRPGFKAVSAGDTLHRSLAHQILQRARLWNGYGPTETTAGAAYARVAEGEGPVPIGRGLQNVGLHVVDEELYISGAGVARGYWSRPALTAERFLNMPFGRAFRTGDRVSVSPDGQLIFLGRFDNQLKIRGVRTEPGEVEAVLLRHPDVRAAAFTADAAYVVGSAPEAELRALLQKHLPPQLQPARILYRQAMPLTAHSKVDRRALAEGAREFPREYDAPRNETERLIANVFAEVLEREPLGIHDHFFHLGGQSLSAARVAMRLNLPVAAIFRYPTAAQLAELRPQRHVPIPRHIGPAQQSFAQERIAFLQEFHDSPLYHLPTYKLFLEPPDRERLQSGLNAIAQRHPVLQAESIELGRTHDPDRSFDLVNGPLIRASLVGRELLICVHHIAFDAWSAAIFFRELDALYQGRTLPPLPVHYADFAAWQRQHLNFASDIAYWRDKLAGAPTLLELPTRGPRPAVQTYSAARFTFPLPPSPFYAEATVFMTALTALYILLSRYTGETDICIGTAVSGRAQPELQDLIGLFINTIPLRTRIPLGAPFPEALQAVRATCLEAFEHQELPFAQLIEAVAPERSLSYTPLFQVMCTQLDMLPPDVEVRSPLTKFDLSLDIGRDALTFEYNTGLFAAGFIERMAGHLTNILNTGTELLTVAERNQILETWNHTAVPIPEDLQLSQVPPLAVEPGTLVPVGAERPPDLARRLHAIWKARATYLAPSWRASSSLPEPDPTLAYVIHTSGSTGEPKAVGVTRRAVINVVTSVCALTGITPRDLLLAITPLTFDIAALELLLPCRVLIATTEQASDPRLLRELLESSQATAMQATPATWRMLVEAGWQGKPGFKILCGGETLTRPLANELLLRGDVWNLYGPTETTIWSTAARVEPGTDSVPIGRPLANTKVFVLDQLQAPVPVGVSGELYIGGAGLAVGYLGRPELTSESFIQHPEFGRLYRTGDQVRWRADGQLLFLKRLDHQIKLRGRRIEPGEIEAAMLQHPAVRAAVVTSDGDQLLAYHVGPTPDLREFLSSRLPAHLLPSHITELPDFPRTPNGKLDRAKLPLPPTASPVAAPPRTETERKLMAIWESALQRHPIGISDNFFALGGHSLQAARLLVEIERQFGKRITLPALFAAPTIEGVARALERDTLPSGLAAIQPNGAGSPFFMVEARSMFWPLAQMLGPARPFLGMHWPDPQLLPEPFQVADLARYFVNLIRARQPAGPYILGGWCMSAAVAFEIAQQLTAQHQAVQHLFLFDGVNPQIYPASPARSVNFLATAARFHLSQVRKLRVREVVPYLKERLQTLRGYSAVQDPKRTGFQKIENMVSAAVARYRPQPYAGAVTYFERGENAPVNGWGPLMPGNLQTLKIPGNHAEMFQSPNVELLSAHVARAIASA